MNLNVIQKLRSNLGRLWNMLRYGYLDPIEYYVDHDRKLVYVENAKCACSSIKKLMYPSVKDTGMEVHELLRPKAQYRIGEKEEGYLIFTVVRNPLSRVVSCYQDKVMLSGEEAKLKGMYETAFFQLVFKLFTGRSLKGRDTQFSEFVKLVAKVPDFIADRHFRSQVSIIHSNPRTLKNIQFIKLEELAEKWSDVLRGRLEVPRRRSNKSQGVDWRSYYREHEEIRKEVTKRYEEDFRVFGYDKTL